MPEGSHEEIPYGALVWWVTQEGQTASLRKSIAERGRFSTSFSSRDVTLLDNEICILAFDFNTLDSIWLGRASNENQTGRRRFIFQKQVALDGLKWVDCDLPDAVREDLELSLGANESRLNPPTWSALVNAIRAKRPTIAKDLDTLNELRKQYSRRVRNSDQRIIAEQWDAMGAAMDFAGFSRDQFLPPLGESVLNRGGPFVLNMESARTLEDDIIAYEMRHFPGWTAPKELRGGIVKLHRRGRRGEPDHELTLINANRKGLEKSLGVDLIFHNGAFNSCVFVQYKRLEQIGITWSFDLNDAQFQKQLEAIRTFKKVHYGEPRFTVPHEYRIGAESFFVKFVQDAIADPQSKSLFVGWYVPIEYIEMLRSSDLTTGRFGGKRISEASVQRWFSNTDFAPLVSAGWVGTTGKTSALINKMVNASLEGDRSLVIALAEQATD